VFAHSSSGNHPVYRQGLWFDYLRGLRGIAFSPLLFSSPSPDSGHFDPLRAHFIVSPILVSFAEALRMVFPPLKIYKRLMASFSTFEHNPPPFHLWVRKAQVSFFTLLGCFAASPPYGCPTLLLDCLRMYDKAVLAYLSPLFLVKPPTHERPLL